VRWLVTLLLPRSAPRICFGAWMVALYAGFSPRKVAETYGPAGEAVMSMQMPPDTTVVTERPVSMAEMGEEMHHVDRDLLVQDTHVHHADVCGDRRSPVCHHPRAHPPALGGLTIITVLFARTLARFRRDVAQRKTGLARLRDGHARRRLGDGSRLYHRGCHSHLSDVVEESMKTLLLGAVTAALLHITPTVVLVKRQDAVKPAVTGRGPIRCTRGACQQPRFTPRPRCRGLEPPRRDGHVLCREASGTRSPVR